MDNAIFIDGVRVIKNRKGEYYIPQKEKVRVIDKLSVLRVQRFLWGLKKID